jgi:Bax protein
VAKVRRFDDLASAVTAYIRNLNTHRAYRDFRVERARLRAAGKEPDGHALAPFIQRYSERGPVYTQMLRSLIQWNNLTAYDGLRLDLSEQSANAATR